MTKRKLLAALGAFVVAAVAAWQEGSLDTFLRDRLDEITRQQTPQGTAPAPREAGAARGSGFDYYVLALSWSPSFCEDSGDRTSHQCNGARDYGFVAHGLWPQNETGWPEFCDVSARVPERTVDRMLPVMPAKGLIFHQWKKHGTCSGLDPRAYFGVVRDAYDAVVIPAELRRLDRTLTIDPQVIEAAFIEANPALDRDGIVINCSRNRLREVRICLDKTLAPRPCGRDVNRECRADTIRMPPVR